MEELQLNDELFNELQDFIRSKMLSANTYRTYSYALNKLFTDYKVLSVQNISRILAKKNSRGQYAYRNPNRRAIFTIINEYCQTKGINFSINIPKIHRKERVIVDIPTFEEIKSLIEIVPYPYSLMLRVIYNFGAGLRISELVRLSWATDCINWYEWVKDKNKSMKCLIKESKRGKSRYVNVSATLMNDLYEYAKKTVGLNEYGIPNSEGFMFDFDNENFRGDLYREDREKWQVELVRYVERWLDYHILRKYSPKAIGRKIHLHSFRNSRASYLYNYENKPIEVIQELLGHKNIETTRVYVKIDFDKIMKSMENLKEV